VLAHARPSGGGGVIKELDGLPAGVIGFEASGKIAAEDYRDVILPALDQAARIGDVRFLILMRDFEGISGGAIWQDLKIGIEHLHSWKRIALVTDIDWMSHLTDLFGWMTPGATRAFRLDQKDQAIRWVAG
jgi:SpoIIAA-like